MDATVIRLWSGSHEKRIRIPGPGEQTFDAKVIVLPVIACRSPLKPMPSRKPIRRTRRHDDDERQAEPIGPGEKETAPATS